MHVQHSGVVHHDRTLHQMMLAEDSRAWDQSHSTRAARLCAGDLASTCSRMSEATLVDAFSPSHASPTDSASSLHADCVLQGDFMRERDDATLPLLRWALSAATFSCYTVPAKEPSSDSAARSDAGVRLQCTVLMA